MKLTLGMMLIFMLSTCNFEDNLKETQLKFNSKKIQAITSITNSPTIVLDVGFAESYDSWKPLLSKLTKNASIFAYNRAGYIGSDVGVFPRTSKQIVEELKTLLEENKIEPPYILVGHSFGALNMQLFLDTLPDKVKAAVLIDPPPLKWLSGESFVELKTIAEKQIELFEEKASLAKNQNEKNFYITLVSEHKEMFDSAIQIFSDIESYNDIPLTIISSSIPNQAFGKDAEAFQKFWIEENEKISKKSSNGKFIIAKNSRHHVHLDNEELVINEIRKYLIK